jgi:hypothetical protein
MKKGYEGLSKELSDIMKRVWWREHWTWLKEV